MSELEADLVTNVQLCVHKVSAKPRYQYMFIVFMCLIWVQVTYSAMIGAFVFMNPLFVCDGQPTSQVKACEDMSHCHITNSFTGSYHDGLYCDRQGTRTAIQSIFSLGAVIGMFGLPALSDAKGRRFAILFGFSIHIFGVSLIILGTYQSIVALMFIGHFVAGIFSSGIVVISYVMTGQLCKDSVRQTAIMFYCAVWALTEVTFIILYDFMPEWYNYLILLILVPSIGMAVTSIYFILDTPQYCLIMAKNLNQFNRVIIQIGMYNSASLEQIESAKSLGQQIIKKFQQRKTNNKAATFKQTMATLLKNKACLVTCICLAISHFSYNIFYYGVQGSLQRTGYNFGVSMLLIGVHEFLAYMTASYFIKKIKRKKGLIVAITITCLIGLTFLLDFVKQNQIAQSVVISLTRIGDVYAYSLLSILETQSFPVQIRSTAMGLTIGLSQLGRIGVPYLITSMNDLGIHPLIASSFFFLFIGILALMPIKQTWKKQEEPQKLVESLLQTEQ